MERGLRYLIVGNGDFSYDKPLSFAVSQKVVVNIKLGRPNGTVQRRVTPELQ